jgi:hypothetical protein
MPLEAEEKLPCSTPNLGQGSLNLAVPNDGIQGCCPGLNNDINRKNYVPTAHGYAGFSVLCFVRSLF